MTTNVIKFRHNYPGKYIVFEGPDLAGKSTLTKRIFEQYGGTYPIVHTQQPSKGPFDNVYARVARSIYMKGDVKVASKVCFESIEFDELFGLYEKGSIGRGHLLNFQKMLQDNMTGTFHPNGLPIFLQMAMLLDRLYHYVCGLVPELERGKMVISDRSLVSGLAYFKSENGDWAWLYQAHVDLIGKDFFLPDQIFYLNVSMEEFRKRKTKRGGQEDHFESADKFQKIKDAYEHILVFFPNVIKINADQSENGVMHDVVQHLFPQGNC